MGVWTPGPGATSGSDTFTGDSSGEIADGLDGADTLNGNGGFDTLTGGTGIDIVNGDAGNDNIVVDDTHDGQADTYNGGADIDTLRLTGAGSVLSYDFYFTTFSSIERIEFLGGSATVATATIRIGQFGAGLSLTSELSGSAATDIVSIYGSDVHTGVTLNLSGFTFTNWSVADQVLINLGNGADTVTGTSNYDYMNGGAGDDTLYGGDDDDSYYVDNAGDVTIDNAGIAGGYDVVFSTVTRTLGANLEALYLTEAAAIDGTGNELNNLIIGNDSANVLNGKAGADLIQGWGGNDTINGEGGNDTLDGGNDNDNLYGGAGTDTIYGRTGNDTVYSGADNDTIYGGDGNDVAFGEDGDDFIDGGNNNDYISGDGGADTVYGRNGEDRIFGGLGNDTLYGGNDADVFVFNTALGAGNVDIIADFNIADDRIELNQAIFTSINLTTLNTNSFVIGTAAADADDYIIYDPATGALYYDADGNGGGAAVQFATLAAGLALTNADFYGYTGP